MVTLFDQEKILEIHDYNVAKEARVEGLLSAIRNLMDSMSWSVEQAMEALRVAEPDRSKYAELLQKQ